MELRLDSPLPTALTIGAGTALFVCGTCFDPRAAITELQFVLDGETQPVAAHGMPRLDVLRALEEPNGYRSGFWGIVRIAPRPLGVKLDLRLRALTSDGRTQTAPLAEIEVKPLPDPVPGPRPDPPPPSAGREPLIAICMGTYDPPPELLRRQVDSIRAQTHQNWVCVISDDSSRPDRFATIQATVGDDPRFVVSRSPRRLGFYLNFERALAMAPAAAEHVALSDQDDYWYPDKLATLRDAIGSAALVYSDARIIGRGGELISPTYWSARANDHADLESLLVANSVTGAASLLRRDVLAWALPFPPAQFAHYHDHWIALVALTRGGIEFVDRPLYDYVQHGQAALGHAAANLTKSLGDRLSTLRADPRERVRVNRARFFVDVQRLMTFATILEMRCGDAMSPAQRRTIAEFLALESSPAALAKLGWRATRELAASPQTLGSHWALFQSLVWRRLLGATARPLPNRRLRLDALPPPDLAPRPQRRTLAEARPREIAEKVAPLDLAVSDGAPRRVNLLIPTIDLEHFFGGYIAKFNLAARLAARGERVRIVTVDAVGPLPREWQTTVESYSGLTRLFDRVEVEFGRATGALEVNCDDAFVATTWWTAHIAAAALRALGRSGFLYLIQEYEPFTFPMGSYAALALQSYRFEHYALFSSELLRGYFRRHAIGVYELGSEAGDAASASFQNAITPVVPPTAAELAARAPRRLLFYARPEPHAARNMYELGVLALRAVLEEGALRGGWELRGIGTTRGSRRVEIGADASLELLPRSAQHDYATLLREHDVGLALMLTPHPSLVPIEMASAGLLTVTNTFENKTAEELTRISANLIGGEPTVEGIADALLTAVASVEDFERRAQASHVRWSGDWQSSFDDALLERVTAYLDSPALARWA